MRAFIKDYGFQSFAAGILIGFGGYIWRDSHYLINHLDVRTVSYGYVDRLEAWNLIGSIAAFVGVAMIILFIYLHFNKVK
jgi:hypothetical protein